MMKNETEVLRQCLVPHPLSVYLQTTPFRSFREGTRSLPVSHAVSKSRVKSKVLGCIHPSSLSSWVHKRFQHAPAGASFACRSTAAPRQCSLLDSGRAC